MSETGPLDPSEHFSFDQMVSAGADPTHDQMANLQALCDPSLEAVRSLLANPLEIVKGFDPTDPGHADGLAVDFTVPGWALRDAYNAISGSTIPFSGLQLEGTPAGPWHIELSIAAPALPQVQDPGQDSSNG